MMKFFTLTFLCCAIAFASFAQYPVVYDLQVSNESYQDLENPISLNENQTWDDPFYFIPIGFPFEYQGTAYNFAVTFFGVGVLGFTNDTSFYYEPKSLPLILAFGADFVDAAYDDDDYNYTAQSESPISYKQSGSDGNAVFTYEVKNAAFYDQLIQYPNPSSSSRVNFQITLKQADHSIEFHYGSNLVEEESFLGNNGLQVGLIADFDFYDYEFENFQFLLNDPSNPDFPIYNTTADAMAAGVTSFLESQPSDGTKYRITNPNQVVGLNDFISENLTIYPTLASDNITIENPLQNKPIIVEVFDIQGKLMQQVNAENKIKLNVEHYPKGAYVVTAKDGLTTYTQQFIKQ